MVFKKVKIIIPFLILNCGYSPEVKKICEDICYRDRPFEVEKCYEECLPKMAKNYKELQDFERALSPSKR